MNDTDSPISPRLIIQQMTFGPPSTYSRVLPEQSVEALEQPVIEAEYHHHSSSSFSRVSYNIRDGADDEEVRMALEKGDGIVGVMFGRSVKEQISSSWFWYVCLSWLLLVVLFYMSCEGQG